MAHLSEQMAKVAIAIYVVRESQIDQERKDLIDAVTREITGIAFGNKSKNQIREFAHLAQYKKEFKESMKQFLEMSEQ